MKRLIGISCFVLNFINIIYVLGLIDNIMVALKLLINLEFEIIQFVAISALIFPIIVIFYLILTRFWEGENNVLAQMDKENEIIRLKIENQDLLKQLE